MKNDENIRSCSRENTLPRQREGVNFFLQFWSQTGREALGGQWMNIFIYYTLYIYVNNGFMVEIRQILRKKKNILFVFKGYTCRFKSEAFASFASIALRPWNEIIRVLTHLELRYKQSYVKYSNQGRQIT
jgi:hypothetical protein